jgi:hypothetical protein
MYVKCINARGAKWLETGKVYKVTQVGELADYSYVLIEVPGGLHRGGLHRGGLHRGGLHRGGHEYMWFTKGRFKEMTNVDLLIAINKGEINVC